MRQSERERLEFLEELNEESEEKIQLEKNDGIALWLAGLLMVGLPCLVVLFIVAIAVLLIFT